MHTVVQKINRIPFEKGIWPLVVLLIVSAFTYGYFVNQTIIHIVQRGDIESKVTAYRSHIADLEFSYLSLKNAVTLDVAKSRGFSEVASTEFVTHSALKKSLTLNNDI